MRKLTTKAVAGKLKPGMHNDGEGLYLHVSKTEAKSWILRTRVHGKKTDIGLGSASLVPLAKARDRARNLRAIARDGGDPLAENRKAAGTPTFSEAAWQVWREQIETTARNEKHKAQWINTLREYAFPVIGDRKVDKVQSNDILAVLQPIWLTKPETARRVRQRLRTVLDWAIAARHRTEANPLAGIETALPKQQDEVEHHTAVSWEDMPGLMGRIAEARGIAAIALRFCILTAARSGEVREACWDEIDWEKALWIVPAARMKGKKEHRVPLTPQALSVLEEVKGLDERLIFPGRKPGKPMSDMTLIAVLKRLDVDATVHGCRSSFRDWAAERTSVPREIAELCLAHKVGNAVERAYARSDLLHKRRGLLERWAEFCLGGNGNVVGLRA